MNAWGGVFLRNKFNYICSLIIFLFIPTWDMRNFSIIGII